MKDRIDEIISETIKGVIQEHTAKPINEMARIRQSKSGLSMIVWINPNDGTNTGQHNMPRLKFQDSTNTRIIQSDLIPMSIDNVSPQILIKDYAPKLPSRTINMLKKWIIKNYVVLMQYWNDEIYEDELIERLVPIS